MRDFFCVFREKRGKQALIGAVVFASSFLFGQPFFAFADTAASNAVQVFVRPSVSCEPSSQTAFINQPVTWKATAQPDSGKYFYVWSSAGAAPASQGPDSRNTYEVKYESVGEKTATVKVTPQVSVGVDISQTATCKSNVSIQEEPKPDLTATTPTAELVAGTGVSTGKANTFYEDSTLRFAGTVTNAPSATAGAPASKTGWRLFKGTSPPPPLPLESSVDTPALAKGASATVSRDIAKVPVGTYYFALCADEPKAIPELREDNNCSGNQATALPAFALKIEVVPLKPPSVQLFIGSKQKTVTGNYGTTHTLSWVSENVLPGSCKPAVGSAPFTVPADPARNINGAASVGPLVNAVNTYLIECRANPDAKGTNGERGGTVIDTVPAVANINPPTVSCSPSPTSANINETITWRAFPVPDKYLDETKIPYSFSWTSAGGNPASGSGNPFLTKYASANPAASAVVRMTAPGGRTASAACQEKVTIVALPDLTSSIVFKKKAGAPLAPGSYFVDTYKVSGTVFNTNGDADTPANTSFYNLYYYANSGAAPPASESGWTDWPQYSMSPLAKGASRAIGDYEWPAGAGRGWWFRACADQQRDGLFGYRKEAGTIAEKNDDNNCFVTGPFEFKTRPPDPKLALTCNSDLNKTVTTENPGICKLAWSAKNVSACRARGPTGSNWNGLLAVSGGAGSGTVDSSSFSGNSTFTLECDPLAGNLNGIQNTNITAIPFTPLCSVPATGVVGVPVKWDASPGRLASGNAYSYSWSGDVTGSGVSVSQSYPAIGDKKGKVAVSTAVSPATGARTFTKTSPQCTVTVTAPDLTANQPTIIGSPPALDASGRVIADTYYEKTLLTISGVINNTGTAETPTGTFNSSYQYATDRIFDTTRHPADDDSRFTHFQKTSLANGAKLPAQGGSGTLAGHAWGEKGDISKGTWYFRVCGDKPANEVAEGNSLGTAETNNCSPVRKIVIVERPEGPAVSLSFNKQTGAATIPYGERGTLAWTSSNASKCTASNNANRGDWAGTITSNTADAKPISDLTRLVTFTLTCDPIPGSEQRSATASVTVVPFTPSCQVSPAPVAALGAPVTWTGRVEPSDGTFAYEWAWNDGRPASLDPVVSNIVYPAVGGKTGTFTVSATVSVNNASVTFPKSVFCSTDVKAPDLTANTPSVIGTSANASAGTEPLTGVPQFFEGSALSITGFVKNSGTLATKDGLFNNEYQLSINGGQTWSRWVTAYLESGEPLPVDKTRDLKPYPGAGQVWNAGILNPDGYWWFKVVADSPESRVVESNENNNNSGVSQIKVVKRPPPPTPSIQFNGQTGAATVEYGEGGALSWSCGRASNAFASNNTDNPDWGGSGYTVVPISGTGVRIGSISQTTEFKITCNPLPGALPQTPVFASVTVVPFTPSCRVPLESRLGEPVTFAGGAEPSGSYVFDWSGDVPQSIDQRVTTTYSATGPKKAAVQVSKTVSVNNQARMFKKDASCSTKVTAPDLTATLLLNSASGALPASGTVFIEEMTLQGVVKNEYDQQYGAPAQGIFPVQYFYSTDNRNWGAWPEAALVSTGDLGNGQSRNANPNRWTPGPGGPWHFRFCADEPVIAGRNVTESNEGNNCSFLGPYTFVKAAELTVSSTRDGQSSTGVSITGSQGGTGGATAYTARLKEKIDTTLSAPATDPTGARLSGWTNSRNESTCTGATCGISVGLNDAKTATAHYLSPSGTLSCAATPTTATLSYSYKNATGLAITRDGGSIKTLGDRDGSGSFTDTGVTPGATYTYRLHNNAPPPNGKDLAQTTCTTPRPPAPTADILFNNSPGPVTIPYDKGGEISWSSKNASSCSASSVPDNIGWKGALSGAFGNVGLSGLKATHSFSLTCQPLTGSLASPATDKVKVIPLSVSCTGKPASVFVDEAVTWTATPSGGNGTYTYHWSGDAGLVAANQPKTTAVYTTPGNKTAQVFVRSDGGESAQATCTAEGTANPYVTVNPRPVISVDLLIDGKLSGAGGTIELPYGATPTLSWTTSGTPDSCAASLDWSGTKAVPSGSAQVGPLSAKSTYDFKISCTKTGALQPATDTVRVKITPTVSCTADKNTALVGETVTWNAVIQSVTQYTLVWSSPDNLVTGSFNPNPVKYQSAGEKRASVTATANGITSPPALCTAPVSTATPTPPPFITIEPRPPAPTADILFNNSPGPVTIPYDKGGEISWTSKNASSCSASSVPDNSGWKGPLSGTFGNVGLSGLKATHAFSLTCQPLSGSLGSPATDKVKVIPLSVSCTGKPASVFVNEAVTWTATPSGGNGTYTYHWSGDDGLVVANEPKTTAVYTTPGNKVAKVFVRSDGGESAQATCTAEVTNTPYVTVKPRPVISVDLLVDGKLSGAGGTLELPYGAKPTLSWTTTGTPDSCTASGDWTGPKTPPTGGSESVGPLSAKSTYDFVISCSKTGALAPVTDTVRVRIKPVVSCTADKNTALVGETVTWNAVIQSVTQYTLVWSGSENLSGSANQITKTYTSAGEKTAKVSVTADGLTATADCKAPDGSAGPDIQTFPDLTANPPTIIGQKIGSLYLARQALTIDGSINNIGTAATADGLFTNLYQASIVDPPRVDSDWFDFAPTYLETGAPVGIGEAGKNRPLKPYTWGQDGSIAPGVWHFRVCVDQKVSAPIPPSQEPAPGYSSSDGTVAEDNVRGDAETAASNCSTPTIVQVVAYPDLVVSKNPAPTAGGTLLHNGNYTFTGEVKNGGTVATPSGVSFKNRFQIVKSTEAGGGTVTLTPNPALAGLGSGAAESVTSGSWPAVAGRHTLILCADTSDTASENNRITESNELNNCSPSAGSVGASTIEVYPKLLTVSPTTATNCGGKITLSYTGGEGAKSFILLRAEGSTAANYAELESATNPNPGLRGLRMLDSVTPDALFYYKLKAVGPDGLEQTSAPRGARSSAACVTAFPDLITDIVTFSYSGTLRPGAVVTFAGMIKNNSNTDVTRAFDNTFTLFNKTSGARVVSFAPISQNGLAKNTPQTLVASPTWSAEAGTYRIQLCADSGRAIDEGSAANESDASNCKDSEFTVGGAPPPPPAGAVTLTAEIQGSGSGSVTSAPAGIAACTSRCSADFSQNSVVTLTADYSPSSATFNGWSSNCTPAQGNGSQCTTTMDAAKTVTATFTVRSGRGSRTNPVAEHPATRCYPRSSPVLLNQNNQATVSWQARAFDGDADGDIDGTPTYTLTWTGDSTVVSACSATASCAFSNVAENSTVTTDVTYTNRGTKNATVEIRDAEGEASTASCTVEVTSGSQGGQAPGGGVPKGPPGGPQGPQGPGGESSIPVPQFEEF